MTRKSYPTDLTDAQWQAIEPHFNQLRHYKWDKRKLVNAVFVHDQNRFVNGVCCPMIFHLIQPYGVSIAEPINQAYGIEFFWHWFKKTFNPSKTSDANLCHYDSQSVKTASSAHDKGFDGGKKIKVTPFSTPNYSIGWVNWVLRMALMYKTAFY